MEMTQFQDTYHWLCGLEEYYKKDPETNERYQLLFKALYHDNWYRKRDIMVELASRNQEHSSNPQHLKAWMNVIMHEHLTDIEIKPQLIATLIRKHMLEEKFSEDVARFINYWAGDDGRAAEMPDMNDFLSRGQVKSKLWMIDELKNIVDGPLGNVVFFGGWYNFLAHMFYDNFDVYRIYSLDLDESVIEPSKRLYREEVEESRFIAMTQDVSKLQWRDKELWYLDYDKRTEQIETWMTENEEKIKQYSIDTEEVFKNFGWRKIDDMNMVINTSCEHMDNTWFENIPDGTLVVLQTNDYFSNEQHVNCCKDVADAKQKYPMSTTLYEGELDTHLYNRFMIIGIK